MTTGKANRIGGNWKFHQPLRGNIAARNFAMDLQERMHYGNIFMTKVSVFPSTWALKEVAERVHTYQDRDLPRLSRLHSNIQDGHSLLEVGAQDVQWGEDGSFTGAPPSPENLLESHVRRTLVGHSETRVYGGVTDALVARKLEAVLRNHIFATVCLGEDAGAKADGATGNVLEKQIVEGIIPALKEEGDTAEPGFEIAYEPLYAIAGFAALSGRKPQAASNDDIEFAHGKIRGVLEFHGFPKLAENVSILYGGSSKAENAEELLSLPFVDGLLVGTASWNLESFMAMIEIAERLSRSA